MVISLVLPTVSRLSNAIISIFRKEEKRISSEQFEQAVNQVLLSDTVADATKSPSSPRKAAGHLRCLACVRILSETVGTLPIHLFHKTSSGREQAKGHPCANILSKPNDYLNRFDSCSTS